MVVHQGFRRCFCLRTLYFVAVTIASLTLLCLFFQQTTSKQNQLSSDYVDSNSQSIKSVQSDENEKSIDECPTIHIAAISSGFNSTRGLYVLLKSILLFRTDRINLHLFVDQLSQIVLSELFRTWEVEDLDVKYYNITNYEREVAWIPGQHYAHRYGLIKLIVPSVLYEEANIDRVILIDTDTLVLGNIRRLWLELNNLVDLQGAEPDGPVFGLVENQSAWYKDDGSLTRKYHHVWPALGQGFNTGLILLNLKALNDRKWRQLWRQVAERELISHLTTSLAEQDILNAMIHHDPGMVVKLSSNYNIQLNDHARLNSYKLLNNLESLKIIHWNSPYKTLTKNPRAKFFYKWYKALQNWDGQLLKESACFGNYLNSVAIKENDKKSDTESITEKLCQDIRPRPSSKLRTFLYYLKIDFELQEPDITIVTHLSIDRLMALDQLANHWEGPISVSIYLSEAETNLLFKSVENSQSLSQRRNIAYHLVFRDDGFSYPINRLRNIALNNSLTQYVLQSDIDFLPSVGLYQYLRKILNDSLIEPKRTMRQFERRVFVVPAFEHLQYRFEFPGSKTDLLTQLDLGSVSMFRDQIWPKGHEPTDYSRWRVSTKPYKVEWRPEYEPFVVSSRDVPRFDERFNGFGWNKVEFIMKLAALDYKFWVLPEAFLIHSIHSASYDIIQHRESSKYRQCVKHLKREFLTEISKDHPEFIQSILATRQPIATVTSPQYDRGT